MSSDFHKIGSTAGLILLDCMILHEILAKFYPQIRTLSQIKTSQNIKLSLEQEWDSILKINYDPVFRLGLDLLRSIPSFPDLNSNLEKLMDLAQSISGSRVLLKHDLMGRIYHQLLLGNLVKYYATLYTSIPAARLISKLIIGSPSRLDFSDPVPRFDSRELKVVDFAVGSGTLLSAIYKEIMLRHMLESEDPDLDKLHEYLIQEGLWGFDVLWHAAHLATLTLFLHRPEVKVSRSRIYVVPLGLPDYLGSLNFLSSPQIPVISAFGSQMGPEQMGISQQEISREQIPSFGICVMNPPFTRSVGGNLLFGALAPNVRSKLQSKFSELLNQQGLSGIGQAGLGAAFFFLADRYLEPEGRLGLVMPRAVLSGVAWEKIRNALLQRYHIEYIITSFQGPDSWNFSENTNYSEILLIARKLSPESRSGSTIFLNLYSKPQNELESICLASAAIQLYSNPDLCDLEDINAPSYGLMLQGKKMGEAYSAKLSGSQLGYYQFFAQPNLNRFLLLLRRGQIYIPNTGIVGRIPLAPLKNFLESIGPDVKQIHDIFRRSSYVQGCKFSGFCGHDSSLVKTIAQIPNSKLDPKPGKSQRALKLWENSSKLLVVERAWLSTYRIMSVELSQQVLSTEWWNLKPKSIQAQDSMLTQDELTKLLALWLNSSYGLMLLLSISEVTEGPWIKFKKSPLWNLPVLDFSKLTQDQIKSLLDLYSQVRNSELKPLPQEFSQPRIRSEIDMGIAKALGMELEMDTIYRLLARDPMITGEKLEEF